MLRYYADIRTFKGKLIRIEISNPNFTGAATEVEVSAGSFVVTQTREGRFGSICSTGWGMDLSSVTNYQYQPMLLEGDLDNECKIYDDGLLAYSGFLENGVYQEEFTAPPYDVNINFNDGINKLKGYYLDATGMWDKMYYDYIELFRIALAPIHRPNLSGNKMLYINNSLYNDAFKPDAAWSCFEQMYLHASTFDNVSISLYDLLEGLLVKGCYIAQVNGDWYIERVKNKIHAGSVDYIAFNMNAPYDVVNNRGTVVSRAGLNYPIGLDIHEFNETPSLEIEKEYGLLNIEVDNSKRDTIISKRYDKAKPIELTVGTDTHNGTTYTSYRTIAHDRAGKASYTWYYTSNIVGRPAVSFAAIASKYGIAKGMELTHAASNSYMYHMFTQSPCHYAIGSKLKITIKVWVDIVQDTIDKKTWVIIPFEFMNYKYINNTNWPNGGKITYYSGGGAGDPKLTEVLARWKDGPYSASGSGFLFFNSDDDTDMFAKWYDGFASDVTIELNAPTYRSQSGRSGAIYDMPYLMLFPSLFCDGAYAPTCESGKIAKTAYGDILVEVTDAEEMESGYKIDKTTTGNYVAKREAPTLGIKYWEGPPIVERDPSESTEVYKTYVNFQYKNLIYTPLWSDVIVTNAEGVVIGVKLIDNSTFDIKVQNSQNLNWYDRLRPIDKYNKKGMLLEHIAQDTFDCYAQAGRIFNGTMLASRRPMMVDTFSLKHIPDTSFIATSIKWMIDDDEYELKLEEIKDRVVETELFIPRVIAGNVTN